MRSLSLISSALVLAVTISQAQAQVQSSSTQVSSQSTGIIYKVGQPGPAYTPPVVDRNAYTTKSTKSIPTFVAIPAFPGKTNVLGGSEYPGPGSAKSATFEVAQALPVVLNWYEDALRHGGWQISKRDLKFSAKLTCTLPGQPCTIDLQFLSIKNGQFHTRVYAKETSYQNLPVSMVGGGKEISPDQVPPLR